MSNVKKQVELRVVKSMQTVVAVPDPAGGAYRSTFDANRYMLDECPVGISIRYTLTEPATVVPLGNVASFVLGLA